MENYGVQNTLNNFSYSFTESLPYPEQIKKDYS